VPRRLNILKTRAREHAAKRQHVLVPFKDSRTHQEAVSHCTLCGAGVHLRTWLPDEVPLRGAWAGRAIDGPAVAGGRCSFKPDAPPVPGKPAAPVVPPEAVAVLRAFFGSTPGPGEARTEILALASAFEGTPHEGERALAAQLQQATGLPLAALAAQLKGET